MKVVEKDIETLSKAITSLKLIKGMKPDMVVEKLMEDPFTLMSDLEIKKHGLDTIIAKVDGLPLPEYPISKMDHNEEISSNPRKLSLSIKQDEDELRSPIMTIVYGGPQQGRQFLTPISPEVDNTSLMAVNKHDLTRCFAKVMYDFEGAQNTQEMSVVCGDVIEVLEQSDDG